MQKFHTAKLSDCNGTDMCKYVLVFLSYESSTLDNILRENAEIQQVNRY